MKFLRDLWLPRNSMMFLVSFTNCSSKSLDTTSEKRNEKMPTTISTGKFMEPKTTMNENVMAALSKLMMKALMTK